MPSLSTLFALRRPSLLPLIAGVLLGLVAFHGRASDEADQLDQQVDSTLKAFAAQVSGAQGFLKAAKGVLVFPRVYQAGFVVGVQHGRGALRIAGRTRDFYRLVSASVGLQLGAQVKSVIVVFLDEESLQSFLNDPGMKVDVDAMATLANAGQGTGLDNLTARGAVIGFVLGPQGLMYQLSLEGAQIRKIEL